MDTGVLCCWLEVPGKETANSGRNRRDNARANAEIDRVTGAGGTIILPNSVIVETARFISQAPRSRRVKAEQLLDRAVASLGPVTPWRNFSEFERLWNKDWYETARQQWPNFADRGVSLTDYSVISIVRYYREIGITCEILTTENSLSDCVADLEVLQIANQRPRR